MLGTDLGAVVVTGDYKFDQTPVDGRAADVARLAELGERAVLCLARRLDQRRPPRRRPRRASVGPALLEVFAAAEGRIIVTCFASNIHRVQQVIDAAPSSHGEVALVGRSMRKNFNIASNLGMPRCPRA